MAAPFPWAGIAAALAGFGANVMSPGRTSSTIAIALDSGRRTVLPTVALGVPLWATAALLGAALVFRQSPSLAPALTALGGALLLDFAGALRQV